MKKQAIPAISVPLSENNKDVSLPWYMYFKRLSDAILNAPRTIFKKDTLSGDGTEDSPLGISDSVMSSISNKAEKADLDGKVSKNGDVMSGKLSVPELSVLSEEGELNMSVVAGVPTIASNNGMDVLSPVTFERPTRTNDNTTWDDANDTDLVRKAQVSAALSEYSKDFSNGFDLFDTKWADHILNDPSWLRADNFSWHSGDVYKSAYEHLLNEFDSTKPIESETSSGVTVYFRTSPDGHKIVLADGEQDVVNMYNAKGVAWYYILDPENKRFKLPRTKFGFTGLRDTVGNYVPAGLPNITANFNAYSYGSGGGSGAVTSAISTSNTLAGGSQSSYNFNNFAIDASRSSSTYGASNTVQPRATQMYLYFYVGDWIKDKELVDVGTIAEGLNNKADVDLLNVTDSGKSLFIHNSAVSGTYKDLPVGAHGTYYTMPEDGCLVIMSTNSQVANSSIGLRNASNNITNQTFIANTNAIYGAAILVAKGQSVQGYYYGQDTSTLTIRFVYLCGNKNKKA